MPLKITLRQDYSLSYFRHLMRLLLTSPIGDSAIICSGYVSEGPRYSVLSDGLLNLIDQGCTNGEVTTVAGMFENEYPQYLQTYCDFVRRLRTIKNVHSYRSTLNNWHAKVAIRTQAGNPVAAIIGSSNLTGPAYGESIHRWNIEADVLLWVDDPGHNDHYRNNPDGSEMGIMDVVLDPEVTRQPAERTQLLKILADVMNRDNLENLNID